MIVFMYIRQREPAKIVSKEWKLTIVFLRGLNVVSPDGNKRIGAHAMLVFLELNGIVLEYSQNELSDLFLSVAASKQNYEDILRWLLLHEQND